MRYAPFPGRYLIRSKLRFVSYICSPQDRSQHCLVSETSCCRWIFFTSLLGCPDDGQWKVSSCFPPAMEEKSSLKNPWCKKPPLLSYIDFTGISASLASTHVMHTPHPLTLRETCNEPQHRYAKMIQHLRQAQQLFGCTRYGHKKDFGDRWYSAREWSTILPTLNRASTFSLVLPPDYRYTVSKSGNHHCTLYSKLCTTEDKHFMHK